MVVALSDIARHLPRPPGNSSEGTGAARLVVLNREYKIFVCSGIDGIDQDHCSWMANKLGDLKYCKMYTLCRMKHSALLHTNLITFSDVAEHCIIFK